MPGCQDALHAITPPPPPSLGLPAGVAKLCGMADVCSYNFATNETHELHNNEPKSRANKATPSSNSCQSCSCFCSPLSFGVCNPVGQKPRNCIHFAFIDSICPGHQSELAPAAASGFGHECRTINLPTDFPLTKQQSPANAGQLFIFPPPPAFTGLPAASSQQEKEQEQPLNL